MPKVAEIISPLDRIRLAGLAVGDAHELYRVAVEVRDQLIVAAVDEGFEQRDVAEAAELSYPRIIAIMGQSERLREDMD